MGVWSQETVLDSGSNAGQGTVFGTSVAVDGNTIVVGSQGEDTYKGAAYVFTKSNNGWSRVARLTAPNSRYGDGFGGSVAIDGDTIVVGAQNWDEGSTDAPQHGAAFIFTKNNNVWSRVARLTASDYAAQDQFGFAVAVEGDTIVVGDFQDDDDGDDSGSVYLFTKPSGGWATANETVQLTASGAAAGDNFGFSVAARGDRFIVGAPGVASEKGAAYVYSIPEWKDITVPASNSGTMSHTVTGLDNGVEYTFWVLPVVSSDLGPASDTVTATPTAAKAATPANLTALGIDQEVTLSWDDPNDASIIRYRYRQKEGDGTFGSWNYIALTDIDSSETGKLKYTVSNLTNGTTYTFQIFAKDNHEDSASAEASATPAPPPPLPLVPPFVSNIGQVTDISVGADADLSRDQAQQFLTGADGAGYVLGSIDVYFQRGTNSANLTVSVWNTNTDGNPGSTAHTLTNPDTIEPGFVRFTAPASAQLAANTTYFVYVAFSASGTPPLLRTTASTNVDVGAAPNWSMTNYRHQAEPSSLTGWAYQSTLLKISINQVLNPPAAPANLEATVGDGHVVLSWDNPQDDYITKYQYSTDSGASYTDIALNDIDSSETEKFKYTVENLTNGRTYTFAVRAVNSADDGDASTKTVVMMPTAPTGLTATPLDAKVELSWDDPKNGTITKYQLLRHAQRATLTATDADLDDKFGNSVVVVGDTAVVGVPGDDDSYGDSGAVLVFTRNSDGNWSQAAKLKASDAANGDEFGSSVAFDGDTIVVGSPFDDNGNGDDSGSAYVFTKPAGGWGSWDALPQTADDEEDKDGLTAKLTASDGAAFDEFGSSVAVDGDTIVVGAYGDGGTKGAAYVFSEPSGGWSAWDDLPQTGANDQVEDRDGLTAKLTAQSAEGGDYFGDSVAIDGDTDTIVVGASGDDGSSTEFIGSALVFVRPGTGWDDSTETAKLIASSRGLQDNFGRSVAIDDDTVVVGAYGQDTNAGAAYVFTKPNGSGGWAEWDPTVDIETAKLSASDRTDGDYFGFSVAIDGDTVVAGAYGYNDTNVGADSGSAYVFVKPDNDDGWADTKYDGNEAAKLTASNGAGSDKFGTSVAIDSGTVVIGAVNAAGGNGAAYAFDVLGASLDSDSTDLVYDVDADTIGYSITGLTNYVTYTFKVRAVNISGAGPASTGTAMPTPAPLAPQNLEATPGDGQAALSWDDPDDSSIIKYQYSADGGANFSDFDGGSSASTTSYTVTGLDNGVTYTLALRAVNPSGEGAVSTATVVMIPAAPKLSAAPGDGQVVLSWADPSNATIDEYQLSQSDPPEWSQITGSNATTTAHTVTGLTNYTGYSFQVRAVNETGAGPASNSANATPRLPKPAKPAGLSAQAGDAQVKLSWQDPNDSTIDKYQISEVISEDFLTASDGAAGAHFGISVAIDGDTAVVGADRANSKKGSAYIFTRDSDGNWTQQVKLEGENTGDQFGWSVAVDGDIVVIGAHAYDGQNDEDETVVNSGAVYVITKPDENANNDDLIDWNDWNSLSDDGKAGLTDTLTPTTPEAYAFFGGSVSVDLDGDTLVAGARLADVEGFFSAGAAYVFTKDSVTGVWSQQAKLTASDGSSLSYLGYSVAVDDDTVLAGAFGSNTAFSRVGYGSAYVFDKPLEGWTDGNETVKLTASDRKPSDYFGFSVALDGDTAVMGARQHNDPITGAGSGAAYVFTKQSGVWGEKAKLNASDAVARDNFGVSVAVDGDTVVVGSWQDDDNGRNSGSAYVFTKPDLGWASAFETLKLTAPDGAANDRFGWSVAVGLDDEHGDLALVGAYSDDNANGMDAGSAHVLGIPNWVNIGDDNDDGIDYNEDGTISHNVVKVPDGTDTDLSNGTPYDLQMRALNRSGAGSASDGVSATPMGVPADLALTAVVGDTQVTLKWAKPAISETIAPIKEYKLSKDDGVSFAFLALRDIEEFDEDGTITNAYTVTDLTNGTTYKFAVRAVNVIGESSSATIEGKPISSTPLAPANLEAHSGDTQVRVTWDDPGDSSIDKYEYRWKKTSDGAFVDSGDNIDTWDEILNSDANTTRYTVTGLTNGTEYQFQVRAVDGSEQEGDASSVSATPRGVDLNNIPIPPGKPTELTATGENEQVTLRWKDPDDSSIDKYQYSKDAGTNFVDIPGSGASTTEYTVVGLTNGTTYTFVVQAVDLVGEGTDDDEYGELSDAVEATPMPGQPREPVNLAATKGDSQVTLTWQHPDTTDARIEKYEFVHLLQTNPLYGEGEVKFGYAVAVDGNTAVIGAYQDDREDDAMTPDVDERAVDSGAAYVFTRVEGVWEKRAKLTASDGEAYDNFGISVAVSGDTIVIGASGDDGDGAADSGSVYVFLKPSAGWAGWKDLADDAKDALTAKLTASDAAPLDYFGHSVAVSGETVLVGASQDDDEVKALEDSGSAYIFVKPASNGGWTDATETAKLTASDAADDDYFGTSVALDGDTAVIGAPGDDDYGIDSGSAYVFVKPDSGWTNTSTQTAKLTDSDGEAGDQFGISVAVDDDTVVIGAYLDDDNGADSGSAYVFVEPDTGNSWADWDDLPQTVEDKNVKDKDALTAKLTPAAAAPLDFFGYSVAVDIDTVVVGAYGDDDNGDESGSGYVFTRDSLTRKWIQTNKLTAKEPEAWDWFGYSVSVDSPGHTALVGAGSAHLLDTHDWEEVPGGKDARTHIVDGLSNGRMYDFKVRGVNSFHRGPPAVGSATPGTGGGSSSANTNPNFIEGDNITRAVAENAAVGTPVGGPVTATDADNDRLEYSLFGEDQASFDLDRWTAQLTTETSLDFEAQNQYSVRVEAKDGNGGYDIVNLTITVGDADEPPSQPGTPEVIVAGPTGLTVGWTEPDNQGPEITDYDVQYREAGGQFQDAGYNGLGTSAALEGLIPGTSYEVQVRAVNDEGVSPWSDSGRAETGDAEEGPVPTEPTIGATPAPTPGPTLAPVTGPTPTVPPTGSGGPTPTAGSPTTTDQGPGFTPESTGAAVPTPMFDPVVKPIPIPQAAPIPESAPTVAPEPPSPVSQVTAPTPGPTPAAEPALPGADGVDGGFPWWIILVILIGIAAAILLIRRKFAGKGQERHSH